MHKIALVLLAMSAVPCMAQPSPVSKDDQRTIGFSSLASYRALQALTAGTPIASATGYDHNPSSDQLFHVLINAPCSAHAEFLFNPGRRGNNPLDRTPFRAGPYEIPANMKIKAAYVWIPDNNEFYTHPSSNPASIMIGDIIEDNITYSNGTMSRSFSLYGFNQTDRGHYINIDLIFVQTDPGPFCH